MRIASSVFVLAALQLGSLAGQTRPLIDYHEHLFSAGIIALSAPAAPATVGLPADLDALLQALGRESQGAPAHPELFSADATLIQATSPNVVSGRDSVVAWWGRRPEPVRLTPVASSVADSAGYITAYVTAAAADTGTIVAYLHLFLRKTPDARWRVAAAAFLPTSHRLGPVSATDLVAQLDAAGMRRGLVLSVAYMYGNPNRPPVEREYAKVRAENDWTARQVAQYPDRLRAFCAFNPLKDYALDELARCAKDPHLHSGLKLHFGNSDVDLHRTEHVAQLRRVFRAANDARMPIVVHLRASVTRRRPWGSDEARIFLSDVLPSAPDIPIQIAHLAGAGSYDDPTDQALAVFAEAIAKHDARMKHVWFDVSGIVDVDFPAVRATLIAKRIREIGVQRVLYGTDGSDDVLAARKGWAAFRQIPLTDAEFRAIAENVTPYMR